MNRKDLAGLLAALGMVLLLLGIGGSVTLDTPIVGEVLGLSKSLSLKLAAVGALLLIAVATVGSLLGSRE